MSEIKYTAPVVAPTPTTPAAPANSIQYNNAGAFGGMANVSADAGNLKFAPINQPSAPTGAGGAGVIYASNDEGDTQLTYINNYNRVTPLQYGFSHKILTQILPGNGPTPLGSGSMFGVTSIILTGTADSNGTAKVNSVFTTLPNLTRQTITSAPPVFVEKAGQIDTVILSAEQYRVLQANQNSSSMAARKKKFETEFGDWIAAQNTWVEKQGIPGADLRPW